MKREATIKESGMLMSPPMVRARHAKRKTQTRRLPKVQPNPLIGGGWEWDSSVTKRVMTYRAGWESDLIADLVDACQLRYGKPGDRLVIRESYRVHGEPDNYQLTYIADGKTIQIDNSEIETGRLKVGKTYPGIHMFRWAARDVPTITGIRAERLQDITEADALAKGIIGLSKDGGQTVKYGLPAADGLPASDEEAKRGEGWIWQDWCASARDAYAKLWDHLNGDKPGCAWKDNPWVFVIEMTPFSPQEVSDGNG